MCGKAFVERAKLQRHQITHTGKKEFQCTYCDKSFGLKHNLLAHMNIHTKYKPWECKSLPEPAFESARGEGCKTPIHVVRPHQLGLNPHQESPQLSNTLTALPLELLRIVTIAKQWTRKLEESGSITGLDPLPQWGSNSLPSNCAGKCPAPAPACRVFQPNGNIFELVKDIIGINLLTKFHEDRK
ncbi:hypothetical protein DPMN_184343 [Dreissena polymorpha]|uniref:C2H2-type domain-containing protein n=1 Tax=Dreissena polymorpha TaxID=45954 RepID=A0A9D4I7A2_DREPO|nr:hypothetical protein DPMN_184343 [Dreissena polymorpha]